MNFWIFSSLLFRFLGSESIRVNAPAITSEVLAEQVQVPLPLGQHRFLLLLHVLYQEFLGRSVLKME